ncbi:hypothetical protein ACFYE2_00550 [Kocuria sp. CPCC 205300]|uniref:hypothetical protein n=1 Tax=Kocuria sabuli TaxID=3071448 RepID=UPI0036DA53FB
MMMHMYVNIWLFIGTVGLAFGAAILAVLPTPKDGNRFSTRSREGVVSGVGLILTVGGLIVCIPGFLQQAAAIHGDPNFWVGTAVFLVLLVGLGIFALWFNDTRKALRREGQQ